MSGNNGCDNDHDLDNMQWVFGEWANATFRVDTRLDASPGPIEASG